MRIGILRLLRKERGRTPSHLTHLVMISVGV
jgi:hypothetical protein